MFQKSVDRFLLDNNITVQSGPEIEEAGLLHGFAEEVSLWLHENAPATIPKSPDELIAAKDNSLYAVMDNHPVGHIAVIHHAEPVPMKAEIVRETNEIWQLQHTSEIWHLQHASLVSLVAQPKGLGLGRVLVGKALAKAESELAANKPEESAEGFFALVTAVVCPASRKTFEAYGFTANTGTNFDQPAGGIRKLSAKEGKLVVGKVLEFAAGDSHD